MRKFVLLILVVLFACPAIASAATKQQYVQVSGIANEKELECVDIFNPEDLEFTPESVTVNALNDMPEDVIEAINAQKIASITVDKQYMVNGKTYIETESVRPAVYYGVVVANSATDADENSAEVYVSKLVYCEVVFPEDIDVSALFNGKEKLKAFQFSPWVYENEPYIRKVYAKDVSFLTYAYGFITEIGEDHLSVDIYPFNDHVYPETKNTDPPTQFNITEDTVWPEPLFAEPTRVNTEVIVIYDEETMEAVAMFYYNG